MATVIWCQAVLYHLVLKLSTMFWYHLTVYSLLCILVLRRLILGWKS